MKIKHVIGVYDNRELYPDYPTLDDVLYRLESDIDIFSKRITNWEKYIDATPEKTNILVNELLENGYVVEKTSKDKTYYVFNKK